MSAAETKDLNDPALRARAVAAARGGAPFDLLISGGRLLDVVTGLTRDADIGVVGPLIASVHAPGSRTSARRDDCRLGSARIWQRAWPGRRALGNRSVPVPAPPYHCSRAFLRSFRSGA